MFDSPFDVCLVCREVVLLDQTQAQCAREHGCPAAGPCPLADYFTGLPCGAARPLPAPAPRRTGRGS